MKKTNSKNNNSHITPFSLKKAIKSVNESMKIEGYEENNDRELKKEARKFAFGK